MKKLFAAAALLAASAVHADTIGPGCAFAWDYNQNDLPLIDGFRVYVNAEPTWEGMPQTVTCADAGVTATGVYSVHVTAFNAADESEGSNSLGFTFVSTAPAAPTLLRITAP